MAPEPIPETDITPAPASTMPDDDEGPAGNIPHSSDPDEEAWLHKNPSVMPPSEPTEPPDSEIGSTEDIADPAAALTPEPEIKDDEIDEDVEVTESPEATLAPDEEDDDETETWAPSESTPVPTEMPTVSDKEFDEKDRSSQHRCTGSRSEINVCDDCVRSYLTDQDACDGCVLEKCPTIEPNICDPKADDANVCAKCRKSYLSNQQACDGCVLEHCKSQPGTPKAICDPESPDRNVCQACQKDYLLDQVACNGCVKEHCLKVTQAPVATQTSATKKQISHTGNVCDPRHPTNVCQACQKEYLRHADACDECVMDSCSPNSAARRRASTIPNACDPGKSRDRDTNVCPKCVKQFLKSEVACNECVESSCDPEDQERDAGGTLPAVNENTVFTATPLQPRTSTPPPSYAPFTPAPLFRTSPPVVEIKTCDGSALKRLRNVIVEVTEECKNSVRDCSDLCLQALKTWGGEVHSVGMDCMKKAINRLSKDDKDMFWRVKTLSFTLCKERDGDLDALDIHAGP